MSYDLKRNLGLKPTNRPTVTLFRLISGGQPGETTIKNVSALSPATEVTFTNGEIKIPLSQVADGDLHRYQAEESGTPVRFWLYQKPDGKIATVFDACDICGSVGFYKKGNGVVCKNCAAPINPQSVGTAGGCNPVPPRTSSWLSISEAFA